MISFELASIFSQLQQPESRLVGTQALAGHSGASQALLFDKNEESGFLPARGLPADLGQCEPWQHFLHACADAGSAHGRLPVAGGDSPAFGIADPARCTVVVLLGAAPDARLRKAIGALLPMLGAKLASERRCEREGERNAVLDSNRRAAEAKLRDADHRKDEFLAMLAHELRNPLAPVSIAARILKIGTADNPRLQQTCDVIERQISHMTSLLDDLLDVSRVTRGLVVLEHQLLDLRAILSDAVEQARPLITARRHHLTLDLGDAAAPVWGDATRLVQIVTNLLDNATRYTPPGGEIGLALRVQAQRIEVRVRDNGNGIGSELLPHVFDLFTQGQRTPDRAQGGLGLGLALVRSLAERHGGTASAASAGQGGGSEFTVALPRAQEAGAPAGSEREGQSERAGEALSVLIVDDNADAAAMLSMFLQAVGYAVRVAHDGHAALALAAQAPAQVMLLDIGLPDMDGYELARRLRRLDQPAALATIALTGYGQPEDRARSRAAGFDHHLTKPVDAAALARLLAQVGG